MVVVRVLPASHSSGSRTSSKFIWVEFLIDSQGLQNLLDRIERMRALGPEFIDITWFVLHETLF